MRYIILVMLIHASCSPSKYMAGRLAEKQLLYDLEYNAIQAEFKLDTALIAKVMDDKFISINDDGIKNKQQELAGIYNNMNQRLKNGHTVDSLYLDNFRADLFENTAIVTFISVTNGKIKQVPYANRRTLFYDVWIKKSGKWKLVSMQATPLK